MALTTLPHPNFTLIDKKLHNYIKPLENQILYVIILSCTSSTKI